MVRCTTCRNRHRRWVSTPPCTRFSPVSPTSSTGALRCSRRRATASSAPHATSKRVWSKPADAGVRENLRVLLVSGEPHAGERVWRNLLKSDAAVDLVHFTILRPPQKQDGTPIHQLSLIAFDRYQHRDILQLLYYENIARYVEQGGALLVADGDDFAGQMSLSRTPLSVVLPATPTGRVLERPFKAKLSVDGAKHPVTRGLPGSEASEPGRSPPGGAGSAR